MILPKHRDSRFITIRRGGKLSDDDHYLLALWAAKCSEHVLHYFEEVQPGDDRPRSLIQMVRDWTRGKVTVATAHKAAFIANTVAREVTGAAKFAALSSGQAVAVAHVAAHELGAAAYAIRAVQAAAPVNEQIQAAKLECLWQREQLPEKIRALVLDDQRLRNDLCWSVFDF